MYTVLCISCHPDDMEIACAGTLAKCVKRGDRVVVCHASSGNLGHVIIPPDELVEIRAKEAERSAEMAGFEIIHSRFDDLEIYDNNKEARDKVVDVIKQVNPDFIITHSPTDYMPDHLEVQKMVFSACFVASCPQYYPSEHKASKVTPIYYMDNLAGMKFEPTMYVDITDEIELKLQMLECHESQIKWLYDHDGCDILDDVRTMSRLRGIQCSRKYAEGFRVCRTGSRNTAERLLP